MVQNRNWETRFELSIARRQQAKQRKQLTQNKKQSKVWAQGLLKLLDRHAELLIVKESVPEIHVWVDHTHMEECEGTSNKASQRRLRTASIGSEVDGNKYSSSPSPSPAGKGGRNRAGSIGSEGGGKGGGRHRSGSLSEYPGKKKKNSHPRSKEYLEDSNNPTLDESMLDVPLLCRNHFFTSTCYEVGRKKAACRHVHYDSNTFLGSRSLHQVLLDSGKSSRRANDDPGSSQRELTLSQEAVVAFRDDDEIMTPGGMDMVHHLVIKLQVQSVQDEASSSSISEQISQALVQNAMKLADIAYVSISNTLIYDRYREGVLFLEDRDFLLAVAGEGAIFGRKLSIACDVEDNEAMLHLPGAVLEHVLTFLPDAAVASLSRVCKSWHVEIGQHSPHLWRHLLKRRNWPLPTTSTHDTMEYRQEFLRHYSVTRDIQALTTGMWALTTNKQVPKKELSYQDFSTRKYAPSYQNACVAVQVWSPSRVLAMYILDSSLRLFETISKGGEQMCKEIACRKVDPYRNTKRRGGTLVSLSLDSDTIVCLFQETQGEAVASIICYSLVIMTREEFVLGESSEVTETFGASDDPELTVIELQPAVVNFLLCSDVVDHRMLELMDFLEDGEEVEEVQVAASRTLVACGHGCFLVEVSISIPGDDEGDDDDGSEATEGAESDRRLLHRKLVMFSTTAGAIVWIGDSSPTSANVLPSLQEEITLAYHYPSGVHTVVDSQSTCTVAIASAFAPTIMVGEFQSTGQIKNAQAIEASEIVREEILQDGWEFEAGSLRRIVITQTDVVAADTFFHPYRLEQQSVVSFYARNPPEGQPSYSTLALPGVVNIVSLACVRDKHLIVVCHGIFQNRYDTPGTITPPFRMDVTSPSRTDVIVIVIDIPSRREIGRTRWISKVLMWQRDDIPFLTVDNSGTTMAIGLSWKGIIMTGSNIRSVSDAASASNLRAECPLRLAVPPKKKKPPKTIKGKKKDKFVRGLSMRG
jgi:hypothetical protein